MTRNKPSKTKFISGMETAKIGRRTFKSHFNQWCFLYGFNHPGQTSNFLQKNYLGNISQNPGTQKVQNRLYVCPPLQDLKWIVVLFWPTLWHNNTQPTSQQEKSPTCTDLWHGICKRIRNFILQYIILLQSENLWPIDLSQGF